MTIAKAVRQANINQHDRFANRVSAYFHGREDRTALAVWGLAFKARTDDVRESPAIYCIRKFLDCRMKVRAYDPQAGPAAMVALNGAIETCPDGYEALDGADALVIFTDWQEFRNPDFEAVAKRLRKPVIFDGRNLYDPEVVRKAGIEYHSIGRASV
jgi:UDPglucose 6-dehydrogenase